VNTDILQADCLRLGLCNFKQEVVSSFLTGRDLEVGRDGPHGSESTNLVLRTRLQRTTEQSGSFKSSPLHYHYYRNSYQDAAI